MQTIPQKTSQIIDHILKWLINYLKLSKHSGFVIGISGGIDSAVTSTLAAKAGANILALELPINQKSDQINRAKEQIDFLKKSFPSLVRNLEVDLSLVSNTFSDKLLGVLLKKEEFFTGKFSLNLDFSIKNLTLANMKSRLRMCALYYYGSLFNYLVLGTGNKIEDFGVGFFTKYGDGGVDLSPIADLTKSQVRALALELGIPLSIREAAPTDGLWEDDRKDEEQLGASYEELEWAMEKIEQGLGPNDFEDKEKELIEKYLLFHHKNLHKMKPIPVCKIPKFF